MDNPSFVVSPGAQFIASKTYSPNNRLPIRRHRPITTTTTTKHGTCSIQSKRTPFNMSNNSSDKTSSNRRLSWPKVLFLTTGTIMSTTFGISTSPKLVNAIDMSMNTNTNNISSPGINVNEQQQRQSSSLFSPLSIKSKDIKNIKKIKREPCIASNAISLDALGIKTEDFLSDRELRRRKTTQFSEAEQEIMELEEWEVDTQWFRDLQAMWAAIFSIGGIFILYRGGVMWESWIKEQEKKDMEEEIELTGTFIDPRAVRKDEDGDDSNNNKGKDKGTDTVSKKPSGNNPDQGGDGGSTDPSGADFKQGDIESLEKLFGKS